MTTLPAPRPRTTADIGREIDRVAWVRDQAIDRLNAAAAELAAHRIDQLLDERLALGRPR